MSVKFGLWTFHKLSKWQKKFDFIDFWLPYSSGLLSLSTSDCVIKTTISRRSENIRLLLKALCGGSMACKSDVGSGT